MGLGKTVQVKWVLYSTMNFLTRGGTYSDEWWFSFFWQAVTYLNLLKRLDDDPGPHLIVCPASVLENWERELRRWCPSFSVILFHGSGRTTYSKELSSRGKAGLPPPFNVLLVCYSLFERRRFVSYCACSSKMFSLRI